MLIEHMLLKQPTAASGPKSLLYTWGAGGSGRLGTPTPSTVNSWTAISKGQRVGTQTLGITSNGLLFAWGRNSYGQLGDGTTTFRQSPVQIGTSSWTAIASGNRHSAAIRSDGGLFTWGRNNFGQLGDGTTTDRSSPVQVGTSSWTAISGAGDHCLAIRSDGGLFTWGYGRYGRLGSGATTNRSSPVQVGTSSWTVVSGGGVHSAAIRSGGGLFTWGFNDRGQLGLNIATSLNRSSPVQVGTGAWSHVSVGGEHTAAINSTGGLFTWGLNTAGQLGLNISVTLNRSSPVAVGSSTWTAVSCGESHTVAIKSGNTLWAWGKNNFGHLGDGTSTARSSPVQIGTSSWTSISAGFGSSAAIKSDGTLWTWGQNEGVGGSGQVGPGFLGEGTEDHQSSPVQVGGQDYHIDRSSPVQVGSISWSAISSKAGNTSGGITSDGLLYMWGRNDSGQIGDSTTVFKGSPVQIGTSSWTALSVGTIASAAIRSDGALFTWGFNLSGQLGDNTKVNKSSPVQIGTSSWTAVSAGDRHMAAIKSDGTLWTWGYNTNGQLGVNIANTLNRSSPVQVGSQAWDSVSAGDRHTAAINTGSKLFTWGLNNSGQLGLNIATSLNRSSPVQVGTSNWTSVSCGKNHTMAIRQDGGLFGWGYNGYGQLGLNIATSLSRSSPVQLGTSSWTAVDAGGAHTMAIRSGGKLFTWGHNNFGQLGDGTNTGRSSPVQVGSLNWNQVAAGYRHSAARSDE